MSSYPPASPGDDSTRKKVARRIIPFVFVLYLFAYLDRANISFARMDMSRELGFSDGVFGFGAGIFFIGYLLLEIPGALLVDRWSARKWFTRILVSWGLISALMAFVKTPAQFYGARFLLGVAEAGFFPGLVVYFTHWFTTRERARAMSGLSMAIPFGLALGAPVSALILKEVDWFGMAGWRWMFILEGLPAVFLGVATYFYLTDRPEQAGWLDARERAAVAEKVAEDKRRKEALGRVTVGQALRQRNVWLMALTLFAANTGGYTFGFWLPETIKGTSDISPWKAAAWTMLPYVCGVASMFVAGRSSDRSGERKKHAALGFVCSAIFLSLSTIPGQPFAMKMFWLCLTGASVYFWIAPFWVLPTLALTDSAAAASIGLINSIGNLGGFIGPFIFGWLLTTGGFSHAASLRCLVVCYVCAAVMVLLIRTRPPAATVQADGGSVPGKELTTS